MLSQFSIQVLWWGIKSVEALLPYWGLMQIYWTILDHTTDHEKDIYTLFVAGDSWILISLTAQPTRLTHGVAYTISSLLCLTYLRWPLPLSMEYKLTARSDALSDQMAICFCSYLQSWMCLHHYWQFEQSWEYDLRAVNESSASTVSGCDQDGTILGMKIFRWFHWRSNPISKFLANLFCLYPSIPTYAPKNTFWINNALRNHNLVFDPCQIVRSFTNSKRPISVISLLCDTKSNVRCLNCNLVFSYDWFCFLFL